MGMWSNDQRNGYGVVVTVDGVYYEGNFFQNRLVVSYVYFKWNSFKKCR